MTNQDIDHISDLKQDRENRRQHNPRNVGMIVDALHEVGPARSIVIDEGGNILAGNATVEAAAEAGIEKVLVVDADGETLVAVRRSGLTPEMKRRLALYDNRTAELANWDIDQLLADVNAGMSFDGVFRQDEIDELLAEVREAEAAEDPGAQIDRAAELQEKWQTAMGQVWGMGAYTVCPECGKVHDLD